MILPDFKQLIIVLGISWIVFRFAKQIALRFTNESDFLRRRNVWYALTVLGFLSPSFWVYALVATPILIWASRKDTNPIAFYLVLLHVIPPIAVALPIVGINALFDMDNYRLLSFCVLVPAARRLYTSMRSEGTSGMTILDVVVLAWGFLLVVQFVPPDLPSNIVLHDSFTNVMRRAFLFLIDVYVLYFVVSRSCSSSRAIIDALAAFCLACAIMSGVASFELVRKWLLYADVGVRWGDAASGFYLFRGGSLRAIASSGNTLTLGYLLAMAFGFWLYLGSHVQSKRLRIGVAVLYWVGLFATYSRGPWMGALAIYFCFAALGRRALSRILKALCIAALAAGVIGASPLGERIVSVLPFMGGSLDRGSIDYRQLLANRSWELFKENPLFGDQLAFSKMGDLHQGQGIIDLVNTYADVGVFHGLVGIALFFGIMLVAIVRTYRASKRIVKSDPDVALLGASLISCMLGTLLILSSCSFLRGYEMIFYVLAGLAAAYTNICRQSAASTQVQLSTVRL
jgi:hypothetical protein